jgi:methyl-accepting chemotaxis protein
MTTLNSFKLKQKVHILMVLPVIIVLVFSVGIITHNLNTTNGVRSLYQYQLAKCAISISKVVHELQKERGLSAGYLGSKGIRFSEMLDEQRMDADLTIEELHQLLSQPQNKKGIFLLNESAAFKQLAELGEIRKQISAQEISVGDQIRYYSSLHDALIMIIKEFSKRDFSASFTKRFLAYTNFLLAKEKTGMERAVLSNVFAKGSFSDSQYKQFTKLKKDQDIFFTVFRQLASPAELSFFESMIQGDSFKEVHYMESVALENKALDVDAQYWYTVMTKKINALKSVETYISNEFINEAVHVKQAAEKKQSYTLIYLLVFIAGILSIVVVAGKSLTTMLDSQ